jgi:hypothetical protein
MTLSLKTHKAAHVEAMIRIKACLSDSVRITMTASLTELASIRRAFKGV